MVSLRIDLSRNERQTKSNNNIELGRGQTDPSDLFIRRGKGLYIVQFHEGTYFRQPQSEGTQKQIQKISDDPLYEPLKNIGVDEAGIRRIFKQHARGLIQRWVRTVWQCDRLLVSLSHADNLQGGRSAIVHDKYPSEVTNKQTLPTASLIHKNRNST